MAGKPPDPPKPSDAATALPGGVVHDDSGNAVWKWSVDAGSTSRLLKQLEVPGLAIDDEPKSTADERAAPLRSSRPPLKGEFNPYGDAAGTSRSPSSRRAVPAKPAQAARPAANASATQPSAEPKQTPVHKPPASPQPVRRRSWLSRLFGGKD